MISRSGVPMSVSISPGYSTWPRMVKTLVPGHLSVPMPRNQSAPLAMMAGMLARVSTLFTAVGFCHRPWVTG